jgi:polar amino acid transport system substrate-binding protein
MRRLSVRGLIPLAAVVLLAGCGSSNSSTTSSTAGTTTTSTTAAAQSQNAAIAAEVPAALKSKGTLIVATEAQYAPNEFIAPDGHTIIGMDPDLMHALGAIMGLKVELVNSNFETIIPGLAAGRYDVGASSFTDTKEREKTVDFVDYFSAGVSFYAKSSANPGVTTIADLCGKTVAVEKGTIEQEQAEAQSKTCAKEAKKAVALLIFTGQNAVNLAVASGRADLGMADSPVVAYQIKEAHGEFKLVGKSYGFQPYGLAIPKTSGMAKPILAALKVLIANGEYHASLAKWGLLEGAIATPGINGATS